MNTNFKQLTVTVLALLTFVFVVGCGAGLQVPIRNADGTCNKAAPIEVQLKCHEATEAVLAEQLNGQARTPPTTNPVPNSDTPRPAPRPRMAPGQLTLVPKCTRANLDLQVQLDNADPGDYAIVRQPFWPCNEGDLVMTVQGLAVPPMSSARFILTVPAQCTSPVHQTEAGCESRGHRFVADMYKNLGAGLLPIGRVQNDTFEFPNQMPGYIFHQKVENWNIRRIGASLEFSPSDEALASFQELTAPDESTAMLDTLLRVE